MKYETQMVSERSDLKVLINVGTHRVFDPLGLRWLVSRH